MKTKTLVIWLIVIGVLGMTSVASAESEHWLNGEWSGTNSQGWFRTFSFEVGIDGEVSGWMTSQRAGEKDQGSLRGKFLGEADTIRVIVNRRKAVEFVFKRLPDGRLQAVGGSFVLTKATK